MSSPLPQRAGTAGDGIPVPFAPEGMRPASRVLQWTAAALLVLLVWYAGHIFLAVFAGVLFGIFLETAARHVSRWTHLSHGWSVSLVVVVLLALAALCFWQMQRVITEQANQLTQKLPQAVEQIRGSLQQSSLGQSLLKRLEGSGQSSGMQQVLSGTGTFAGALLSGGVTLLVIFFVGIYTAAEPRFYKRGILHLFPPHKRDRAGEVLAHTADALRRWIVGKLCTMAIVGVLTGVGLSLLGIESALLLAVLSALLELIPNFGPLIAAIPAMLAGLTEGPATAGYVALLYVGIQLLESYLILPLIQRRAVEAPPALIIVAVVLLGYLGGVIGALVATPLLVALMVLTDRVYRREILGDDVE